MKKYLNYIKFPAILVGSILIFTFICTLFYCFTSMSYNFLANTLFIFIILLLFFYNFIGVKYVESKGYKYGAKNGLITVLCFYSIGGVLFGFKISLSKVIYYIILFVVSILGSMIGINTKK